MLNRQYPYFSLVTDDEAIRIRDAAMTILCKSGFRMESRMLLEAAEKRGFQVDFAKQWIAVTPDMFTALEGCARRHAPEANKETVLRRLPSDGFKLGRNIVKRVDWATKESRQAVMADNIEIMKACHMLPDVSAVAPLFTGSDIVSAIEPIVGMAHALTISDKPFGGIEMMSGGQLPWLERLDTLKQGKEVRYDHGWASITRFTLDRRAASCLEAIHQKNSLKGWGTNSCPFAGMNAPITVAGSAALAMAEMMGGWLAGWILNDEAILYCTPVSGTLDMRTTRILFSTPQATLIDALLCQVFNRLYSLENGADCAATYVDGKIPGLQAVHDKMFKTLSMFSLTGCNVGIHFGMLEAGGSLSPAQMVLDFELNREMEQITQGISLDNDALGLDTILETGVEGDYLTTDHTLDRYKTSLWQSNLFDCSCFGDADTEFRKDHIALERAQSVYDGALARYEPITVDAGMRRDVDAVLAGARKELLNH